MANHILIIGPAWVGDTVMAQVLFKLLKQRYPDCKIDVVAPAWTFSLLSRMKEVSRTIELPITHGEFKWRARYRLGRALRAEHYNQAIVLPNSWKSALIPWFARIPQRTGWRGEYRYGLLNDIRYLDKKRYPLMIEQFMALGLAQNEALPKEYHSPSFAIDEKSQNITLLKHQLSLPARPVLALCAGAEYGPSKRWPEEYYAEVAQQKINDGWDVWLFGSQKDKTMTDRIMQLISNQLINNNQLTSNQLANTRCHNLAGKLLLTETIDLLSLVSGVVTNDSGLMHVAAALKKPLIALYGPTSPTFTPPLSQDARILKLDLDCQPCFLRNCPLKHHRCLRDISPNQVLALMQEWKN